MAAVPVWIDAIMARRFRPWFRTNLRVRCALSMRQQKSPAALRLQFPSSRSFALQALISLERLGPYRKFFRPTHKLS